MKNRVYHGIEQNTSPNTHNVVAELLAEEVDIAKVLDLPCGAGALTLRLQRAGLLAYAADCVNLIKVPDAKFLVCDMNSPLPYGRGSFDAVVCIDGLAHIERPWDFLRECHRILRPKGILIISTPNISSLRSRWRWFLTGFHNKRKTPLNEGRVSPQHIINIVSFHTLRYMLHTNGFKISQLRTNRIKAISWLYAPLVPLSYWLTRGVFHREETDPAQRARNKEILQQMFLRQILFGETLIVKAVRE